MKFSITHYTYTNPKIGADLGGYRIAQVSDLHSADYGRELICAIRDFAPHIIAVTGDIFDRHRPDVSAPTFSFLHQAMVLAPVFFIEGNHEGKLEGYPRLKRQMQEIGVHTMENETVELCFGTASFRLIGLTDKADLQTIKALASPDKLNILLSHRVEKFDSYMQAGIDLALCGHAHGGQARLFGIGAYAPQQGLFPKYTKGIYQKAQTTMIASAGLGDGRFRRINNPRELVCVTLSANWQKQIEQ